MEDLFPAIFIIIGMVASIVSSSKKEKAKKEAEERRRQIAAARTKATQESAAAPKPMPMPKPMPAVQPVVQIPAPPVHQPLAAAQPQVHVHLEPDCDTHDAPGSLGVSSMEGKDPCHEDDLTYSRTYAEDAEQEGGLTFDWSGQSLVKAIVMQEVLTRPCQRRAR